MRDSRDSKRGDRSARIALDETSVAHDTLSETASDSEPLDAVPSPDDEVPLAEQGRYEVLREFAHGGLGRILEANDRRLGRKVAIKELRVRGARQQARFLREAMITARLQHPSIVPLYDVGRWPTGEPYYSMKLVSGRPLDKVTRESSTLEQRLALIPHVIAVADAIAYSHDKRIIHRDLKPSNVLVGEFGETIVIDWGIAKDLDATEPSAADSGPISEPPLSESSPSLTNAGEVVGTPVYMAPEQAKGQALDARADVYSIGAILYEVLTGVWPHSGATSVQVISRLISAEPFPTVEQLQPGVPRELAAIVKKAMSYQRELRYPSAAELAADLRRFQAGQLVAAHRYSPGQRLRRFVRRQRAVVSTAAVMLAALIAVATLSVRSIVRERNATRAERDRLILAQAQGELERDPTGAVAWLKLYPKSGAEQTRAKDIAIDARARGVARYVLPSPPTIVSGVFSPDGRRYAQPGPDGVHVVDLEHGTVTRPITQGEVNAAWFPDGQHLIVQSEALPRVTSIVGLDGTAIALDGRMSNHWRTVGATLVANDNATIVMLTVEHGLRRFHAGRPDGENLWTPFRLDTYTHMNNRFASLSRDGELVWWSDGETTAHTLAHPPSAQLATTAYMLLGDGSSLVAGTTDGSLCVWTLPDGTLRVLDGDHVALHDVTASSDGQTVVTVDDDSTLRVWRPNQSKSHALPSVGTVAAMSLAADGKKLLVGLRDHRVMLLDTATGGSTTLGLHPSAVNYVSLGADGRWAASDGDESATRLWQIREDEQITLRSGLDKISALATTVDGTAIAAGGGDGRIALWNGGELHVLEGHKKGVVAAQFSDDGKSLATGGTDHSIILWDVATGAQRGPRLEANAGDVISIALSRDGVRVLSSHNRGDVLLWDTALSRSRKLATIDGIRHIDVSPDETLVAASDPTGSIHLVPIDGSPEQVLHGGSTLAWNVRFVPDGRQLISGDMKGLVIRWDVATGAAHQLGSVNGPASFLAVSADGHYVAAGTFVGEIAIWDISGATERLVLRAIAHPGGVTGLAWLHDLLITAGSEGAVRLWDAVAGSERSHLRVEDGVNALAVATTGDQIVVGGRTTVSRWGLGAFGGALGAIPLPVFASSLTTARMDPRTNQLAASFETSDTSP